MPKITDDSYDSGSGEIDTPISMLSLSDEWSDEWSLSEEWFVDSSISSFATILKKWEKKQKSIQ